MPNLFLTVNIVSDETVMLRIMLPSTKDHPDAILTSIGRVLLTQHCYSRDDTISIRMKTGNGVQEKGRTRG